MKITFKEARSLISTKVNGCEKFQPNQLADLIWFAETEAYQSGKWWDMKKKLYMRNIEGRIVLPPEYDVLEGLNINGVPQAVQSDWYWTNPSGPGSDWCCEYNVSVVDLVTVPTIWRVKEGERVAVVARVCEDAEAYVIVQGTNTDGNTIYRYYNESNCTERVELSDLGEKLVLKLGEPQATYAYFAEDGITDIFKPVTRGPVDVFAMGPRYLRKLVTLEPSQTESSLRAYRLPTACGRCQVIEALVKRREPIRYTQDHEVLQIQSVTALISLAMSVYYKYNKFDPDKASYYFADGIKALNGQLTEKNGANLRQIRVTTSSTARNKAQSPASY